MVKSGPTFGRPLFSVSSAGESEVFVHLAALM